MNAPRQPPLTGYATATLLTALALLLTGLLFPESRRDTFMLVLPAVMLSALYGGLGPGLLASLLGAVGATFFLLPPAYTFAVALPADLLRLFLFSATATLVSYLASARRRAEEAARARSETVRFQAELLDAVDQAVIATDLKGRITYWNRFAQELYGWSAAEALGQPLMELLPAYTERAQAETIMALLRQGHSWSGEFEVRHRDGRVFTALVTTSPIRDGQGEPEGLVGVSLDISERKRAEEALRESEERYRRLAESQKRFVADAAHELRAPLTAIQGNLQLLLRFEGIDGRERREALSDAAREAERLSRLVNDMLALARGDAGLRLRLEPVRLDEVLQEAFVTARSLGNRHRLEPPGPRPLTVHGDRDRLKQLALILLENALKYTPEGGTVRLGLEQSGGWAELRVSDTGVGIAPEHLPHVFERFWRADPSRSRDPGGTGLGLSIAKWVVEQHGGEIRLESELGKGTTAIVRLPLERARQPTPSASEGG